MKKQEFRNGDLIYTGTFLRSTMGGFTPASFPDGLAVAVLIGKVPKRGPDLPKEQIFASLGSCGLITFDDVSEFLGEEQAKVCMDMFRQKYDKKQGSLLLADKET